MYRNRRQSGVTLLEVILALVIGGAILLLGLQQYTNYRRDSDISTLQQNVDVLFHALSLYYKANCANSETLGSASTSPNAYAVPLSDLVSSGFLNLAELRPSPFVDTASGTNGYILQFNPAYATREIGMSDGTVRNIGTVAGWQAQVAVSLNPNYNAQSLRLALGADCLSTSSQSTVAACGSGSTGNVAVFARSSTLSSLRGSPNTWYSRSRTQLFKQMYETAPILNLTGQSDLANNQFYRCGG